jgi:hypothetical protein
MGISLVLRKTVGAGTPRERKNRALNLVLRVSGSLIGLYRPERPILVSNGGVFALTGAFCVKGFYY